MDEIAHAQQVVLDQVSQLRQESAQLAMEIVQNPDFPSHFVVVPDRQRKGGLMTDAYRIHLLCSGSVDNGFCHATDHPGYQVCVRF